MSATTELQCFNSFSFYFKNLKESSDRKWDESRARHAARGHGNLVSMKHDIQLSMLQLVLVYDEQRGNRISDFMHVMVQEQHLIQI